MITKMTGILQRVFDDEARVQVGPLEYQVLVPEFVRRNIQDKTGQEITLHTTDYLEGSEGPGQVASRSGGPARSCQGLFVRQREGAEIRPGQV